MILTKGKTKEINIESFIDSLIVADNIDSALIVVPTNRKLRELKKKILNNYSKYPITKLNIETFTTLSASILKEKQAFISLTEAMASVLIKQTAEELELSYFAAYSRGIPFGTLDKIKNVISEYKKHGILPDDLIRESSKLTGGEKFKALDIADIYKSYLQKCEQLSAYEVGDVYKNLSKFSKDEAEKIFKECYKGVKKILFIGFDEFTKQEIEILNLFSEVVDHELIINLDYYNNINLFAHLEDTYSYLEENGFKKIIDKVPMETAGFRNLLRDKLFNRNSEKIVESYKSKLHLFKAGSRIEEVEFIAKTIKLHILNEKIEPHKICVAFNMISNYSSLVRDVFNKYKIPVNLTDRIPLKTSPPIVAIISLLQLIENDFYFNDLIRVLTSGLLRFKDIDLNNLYKVAGELKITKGLNNWLASIEDAINLVNYDDALTEIDKRRRVENYREAKNSIEKISKILMPLKVKNTGKEFLKNLKKLLLELQLPILIMEEAPGKEEEFIKAVTELFQNLEEILNLIGEDNENYPLSFFIDHIKTISNWARFNIKEKSDRGVLVTSVNEIRGLQFDYLFLGGMCDGDFPTRYSPEIFFSGSFIKKEQTHQMEERYHFYQSLCAWEKKLFISVPLNESEKELVESTFVKDLQKIFEFTIADNNYDEVILSDEELQIKFAENNNEEILKEAVLKNNVYPEDLKNKIAVRTKRISDPFTSNEYGGIIGEQNQGVEQYLNEFSAKQFSVSQMETFAKCPFKYYAERILRLEPVAEPSEEAEPIELGNVLHSILAEFYENIVKENRAVGKRGTKEFKQSEELLFKIAEDKITKLNLNSPITFFEKEKILGIDGNRQNSILYKFLIEESDTETSFKPSYIEYGFGTFSNAESNNIPPMEINKLKLRGKIDRIDIDDKNKLFNVIDYKLRGKKPTVTDLRKGLSLQLPVYLMAGEYILKFLNDENYNGWKMIIYSLDFKDKNFGKKEINFTRKQSLEIDDYIALNREQMEITKEMLGKYHDKITKGKFHLSELEDREDKVCNYCDFKSLCRVKEVFEAST